MKTDTLSQIPLWVRIKTGYDSRLVEVPELKSQLEEHNIPVQLSFPWYPSCSTGLEFVFELFVNIKIEDIILSGILYDGFKYAVKKVLHSLNSFTEKNKQEDFEPYLIIHLDDVTITLDGYEYSLIEVQTMILEEIASHIDHLNKQGIYYISQIDIPCPPYCLPENIPLTLENKIWKIVYGADECAYYIPNSKQLL